MQKSPFLNDVQGCATILERTIISEYVGLFFYQLKAMNNLLVNLQFPALAQALQLEW